jgi:hypothetical protein
VRIPALAERHRIMAKVNELMAPCNRPEANLATVDETRCCLLEALLAQAVASDGGARTGGCRMNLRDALKADFGIDVLVERGSGQRDDPFVIEPCSAVDATRTQLNLLRGLGSGRREMWRLLQAETAREIAPLVQRLRIEAISFTPNEIISETRAYYFDISQVDGAPDAGTPLIEWTDPRTTFSAVSQIGWLHFDGAIDNSQDEDALDTSLLYSGLGAKATIYVYSSGGRSPQKLRAVERRAQELQSACNQVHASYTSAETPWPVRLAEPFALQHFLIGENISVAGVAILGSHFLKLRLTYFDDPKMRELMCDTVRELARLALRN